MSCGAAISAATGNGSGAHRASASGIAVCGGGAHDFCQPNPGAPIAIKGTSMPTSVTREAIAAAYQRIKPFVRHTPVMVLDGADFGLPGTEITLKLELAQHAGSFKTRGAFANLLLREVPGVGVAAASGGNHGAAVAFAAMRLGHKAKIFVPEISSPAKIARIRHYGADLAVGGRVYADALAACEAWVANSGALAIHAFDQRETMLGQGTVGLELEQQAPGLDTLLVAVGGGGLIAGIAAWYAGRVKVVGVEPRLAPTLSMALAAGSPVDAPAGGMAADSLAPQRIGEHVFPIARRHVTAAVLVEDDAIARAQQGLWEMVRIVAEPGAAAPLAALLSKAYVPANGERVGVLLSGANTTAVSFKLP
jgi:threonine dehydratase